MPQDKDKEKWVPEGATLDQDRDYPEGGPPGSPGAAQAAMPEHTAWDTVRQVGRAAGEIIARPPGAYEGYARIGRLLTGQPAEKPAAPAAPAAAPKAGATNAPAEKQGLFDQMVHAVGEQTGEFLSEAQKQALRTIWGGLTWRMPTSKEGFKKMFVEPVTEIGGKYLKATSPVEKAGYLGGMTLPLVGPEAVTAGEEVGRGHVGKGLGHMVGTLAGLEAFGGEREEPKAAAAKRGAAPPAALPETPAAPRGGGPGTLPELPPAPTPAPREPIPSADARLNALAKAKFGKQYWELQPEEKVVVARDLRPPGEERRVVRGQGPTMERRAEQMPLPTKAPGAPTGAAPAEPFKIETKMGIPWATNWGGPDISIPQNLLADRAAVDRYVAEKQALQRAGMAARGIPSKPPATPSPGQPAPQGAPSQEMPRTGVPPAPPPTTLPSTPAAGAGQPAAPGAPNVPPLTLDQVLRQMTGQKEPPKAPPGKPLRGPGIEEERPPPVTEPRSLKDEFPDNRIRQYVHANGVELGRSGATPEVMQAVHDLKNWQIREAAINAGIDVGTKHVGSRAALGPEQVARQDLVDQIIQKGYKPEEIPRLAQPKVQQIAAGDLKVGDTFVDDKGEPRRVVYITKEGKIKTADGTARTYEGGIQSQGNLNSPQAQLARGGKFIPGPGEGFSRPTGSTVPLREQPQPMKGKPSTLDVAMELSKMTRRQLPKLIYGVAKPEVQVARATAILEDEARFQLQQAQTGGDFYTKEMAEHDRLAPQLREAFANPAKLAIFKWVEAITSTLAQPYQNIGMAKRVWDTYKNSEFSRWNPASEEQVPITAKNQNLELYDKVKIGMKAGKPVYKRVVGKSGGNWTIASSWGPMGIDGYGNALDTLSRLIKDKGEAGASQWLLDRHPTTELQQYNPNVGGEADSMQRGALVFGEKRGPFGLNLYGILDEFTGDRWVARTWNRIMGTAEIDGEGKLVDAPRNRGERALIKESFGNVANTLKLDISELQAVQWRYEQELWTAMGAARETGSFSESMARHIQEEAAARAKAAAPAAKGTTRRMSVSRGASRAGP